MQYIYKYIYIYIYISDTTPSHTVPSTVAPRSGLGMERGGWAGALTEDLQRGGARATAATGDPGAARKARIRKRGKSEEGGSGEVCWVGMQGRGIPKVLDKAQKHQTKGATHNNNR